MPRSRPVPRLRTSPGPQWPGLLFILHLLASSLLGQSARAPETAELDQAVADLASERFPIREAGTRFLWQHADLALSQLEAARQSPDPEVRLRAERIWEAYRLGIMPDTPRAVVEQIYAFHDGSTAEKRNIISQLVASDNLSTAHRLLRSLDDGALRQELVLIVATHTRAKLLPHLLSQDWDGARALLSKAAIGDLGMRDYAAFLRSTDGIDDDTLDRAKGEEPRLAIWLLRAAGRIDEALELADKLNDIKLQREIRAGVGDAVAICEAQLEQLDPGSPQALRAQSFLADLKNDQAAFTQAKEALLKLAKNDRDSYNQQVALDALILHGIVDDILPWLPKRIQQTAYDVQSFRGLYRDALQQLGLQAERPPFEEWTKARCQNIAEDKQSNLAYQEIEDLAGHLVGAGEKEEAARIMEQAYLAMKEQPALRLMLVAEEFRLGLREQSRAHLRALHDSGVRIDQLRRLVSANQPDLIAQWHEYFVNQDMAENAREPDRLEALLEAYTMVDRQEGDPKAPAELVSHLDAAHEKAQALNPGERINYLRNLYLTASVLKAKERARRYLEELANLTQDITWTYELGSAHAEDGEWEQAAKAFENTWERHSAQIKATLSTTVQARSGRADTRDRLQPSFLYLAGMAHRKAGKVERGEAMISQARLLCLGDLSARYRLALTMDLHGDEAMAVEEWELTARLAQLEEFEGTRAFYFLAQHWGLHDPAKAVRFQDRVLVARQALDGLFSPNARLTGSLRMRSLRHQWQAKAQLLAGNVEEALKALQLYWELTPGNASIGEELLPLLEEAGRPKEAREYYDKTREYALEACRVFPRSAMAHNNLAWLDARSRRQLEEAKKHAETAISIRPETAAYIDTLAEVYFAMGNREKALELSDQAVVLTPEDKELLGQRKRFQEAPLPEKRPPGE